jgi:class 3 adenylate cyclase/tetratricopeptide (TPR) repeat protein
MLGRQRLPYLLSTEVGTISMTKSLQCQCVVVPPEVGGPVNGKFRRAKIIDGCCCIRRDVWLYLECSRSMEFQARLKIVIHAQHDRTKKDQDNQDKFFSGSALSMICPQCQSDNPPNAAFCDQCGARLETACPNCGEPNRRTAKFCRNCGQTINQTQSVSPSAATAPGPETYVPKHLAEKILATRHTLEGERKQITVLFADIRGSTSLLEGLDPEEGQKIIDPVLHVMMDAVHRYEGTVNQVLGDGIMALFGAPLAHEDHALRACYAALAMQDEMRRYRQRLGHSEESGVQISVGLNSGEVVVRSIDNDLNIDYSALGHTTHLAARMQELAGPGLALMSASTLRQVEGFIQVQSLGPVQAKGVSQPVETYSLIGATSARTRVQAGAARGLTPLVGRRAEIEVFNKLVEQAEAGKGQILAMVGEPGMGKSRLVHEFTRHQLRPGWLVLEGASVSYGKATPYFPLIEMLRRYLAVSEGEGVESVQAKVAEKILSIEKDGVLTDAIPPILALLGALPDGEIKNSATKREAILDSIKRFNDLEPQQRRRRTFESLKRLLLREAQQQPLLVIFEDLHWIDNETQAFLDSLVESLPMTRILLLVNYRPGYTHAWVDKTYYTQLRVEPLQATSAEELLGHLLGNNADLKALKELLIRRTEGNPFFAEESVHSLVETGILVGTKRAYRPGLQVNNVRIPSTVESVVADRIDRLSTADKHLLQTAAVIGVEVPLNLLHAVADLSEEELHRGLSKLQTSEFLYESNLFPEVKYAFRHALTNEVAYGALLVGRRILLHARIVEALETLSGQGSQDYLEQLAHHAFHGQLWDKAASHADLAGRRALSRSANYEAVGFLEMALTALRNRPQTRECLERAVDIRLHLRNALFLLGDFAKLYANLREAESIAEKLGDQRRLGRILNFFATYHGLIGQHGHAIAACQRALTLNHEDEELNTVSHYYLGQSYVFTGQYDESIKVLSRVLDQVSNERHKFERFGTAVIISVLCRVYMVQCLAQLGAFKEGLSIGREGMQIAKEAAHAYSLAYATCSVGLLLLVKGDISDAIQVLEDALQQCYQAEIRVLYPQIASYLGLAYALSTRLCEAVPLMEKADEETRRIGRKAGQALRQVWHGFVSLLAGRIEEANVQAERALQLSLETKERGHQAWALFLMSDIAARIDTKEKAQNHYHQALTLAKELKMNPLQAHCYLRLGDSYATAGEVELARSEFTAAAKLYQSMDMTFWLKRANEVLGDAS